MRNIQINKKKGMSIGDMYPAVLTVILVGIVLGVGLYVLSTFRTTIATSYNGVQDGLNSSTGSSTLTAASLAQFDVSAIAAINGTGGGTLTNYTFTGAGVITWGADIVAANGDTLINTTFVYTYDATSSPEEAITTTVSGLATFADWIAIIVVVIAAAIVLGIVLTSFGRKRNMI